jgi:hypothetical protein
MESINSKIINDFFEQMDKDPWYIKFNRWVKLKKWLFICSLRKYGFKK